MGAHLRVLVSGRFSMRQWQRWMKRTIPGSLDDFFHFIFPWYPFYHRIRNIAVQPTAFPTAGALCKVGYSQSFLYRESSLSGFVCSQRKLFTRRFAPLPLCVLLAGT